MTDIKYDFDDILIVSNPTTQISSRYRDITLPNRLPLFTAPMDTVVNLDNVDNFIDRGISVCLPRTIKPIEAYIRKTQFPHLMTNKKMVEESHVVWYHDEMFPSIGLGDYQDLCHKRPDILLTFKNILIDVANGHMEDILHACWHIKSYNPDIKIMVGNIGNPETYRWYAESGKVDYVRVGIGNGGGCLTTKQSGVGYPMASLIHETYLIKKELMKKHHSWHLPAIVADGGMKDYVDIIKSLYLGADYVMAGSIFNKALESCAQNYFRGRKVSPERAEKLFLKGKTIKKHFRGMSTKGAQKAMGKTTVKTSEGVERFREVEYTLDSWIENFKHYLRNAMSYANAYELDEFIGKAEICQITRNAYDRFNK